MSLGHFGGSSPTLPQIRKGGSGISGLLEIGQDSLNQAKDQLKESPEGAYTIRRIKTGTFSRNTATASGTQAITGIGFKPDFAIFVMVQGATVGEMSIGLTDGSTDVVVFDASVTTADTWDKATSGSCIYDDEGANGTYTGSIQSANGSFDLDGFTIGWTRNSTPAGTITVLYLVGSRG